MASDRVTGWAFVVAGGCAAAAMVARAAQGHSAGWWEWPAVTAMSALLVLLGLVLILARPPGWLVLVVLVGYGLGLVAFGLYAVVAPDAVLVTAGRGPRTPGTARVMGLTFIVCGAITAGAASQLARRDTEQDATDRQVEG